MTAASLWPALALLLVLAMLPLAVKLARNKGWVKLPAHSGVATVRSITHVGPGQRLLTVDIRDGTHTHTLLLGATSHTLQVLDKWPTPAQAPSYADTARMQSLPPAAAQQPDQQRPA